MSLQQTQWGTLSCHAQAWKGICSAVCSSSMLTVQSWVSSPTKLFRLFQLSQPQLFTKLNKEPFIDTRLLSAYLPEQSATGSQSSGHRPLPPILLHSSQSPPAQGHLVIQNRRPTPHISQKHWWGWCRRQKLVGLPL